MQRAKTEMILHFFSIRLWFTRFLYLCTKDCGQGINIRKEVAFGCISCGLFEGGVGKTTLTANLGAALSLMGKKVLLVDLDPQNDLTRSFGIDSFQLRASNIVGKAPEI
ncbi:MAG: AAA family ATPase [Calditrichia bacterium]